MYSVSKPNQIFFVGNFDSEEDEDYTITEDSLLSDSVTFAAGTSSTQTTGKRRSMIEINLFKHTFVYVGKWS